MQELKDPRFDAYHFAFQPTWLVRQAVRSIQQSRNLDQITQARSNLLFCNANRGKDAPPYDDVSIFLPHPAIWMQSIAEKKVDIDRATAIAFLRTYKKFSPSVEAAFEDWLQDIILIAQG